jgi:hypothetical protein
MGSTGDPPVPVGDPPTGMAGRSHFAQPLIISGVLAHATRLKLPLPIKIILILIVILSLAIIFYLDLA